MMLGALLDLGLPLDALKGALGSLAVDYEVSAERVTRAGVSATKFRLAEAPSAAGGEGGRSAAAAARALPPERDRQQDPPVGAEAREPGARGPPVRAAGGGRVGDPQHADREGPPPRGRRPRLDHRHRRRRLRLRVVRHRRHRVVAAERRRRHGALRARGVSRCRRRRRRGCWRACPCTATARRELVTPTGALLVTGYARAFGPLPAMSIDRHRLRRRGSRSQGHAERPAHPAGRATRQPRTSGIGHRTSDDRVVEDRVRDRRHESAALRPADGRRCSPPARWTCSTRRCR